MEKKLVTKKEFLLVVFDRENHEFSVESIKASSEKETITQFRLSNENYSITQIKSV